MSTRVAADWLSLFDARQQVFCGPVLEAASGYLRGARIPGAGWGPYPKLESDLHHSSIVVQALYSISDHSSVGLVAGAASYLRSNWGCISDGISLEDACDLLMLSHVEQRPGDEEYIDQLFHSIERIYTALDAKDEPVSVRYICSILLGLFDVERGDSKLAHTLKDRLLSQQNSDGSWPAVSGESGSIVASAFALRVLARLDKNSTAFKRGISFVRGQLEEKGWQNIGLGGDTFTHAIVLRTLAEIPSIDYECVQDGIEILLKRANSDGSWGAGPGEPGNIEITALSLLALVAVGENRYIPARLAKTAVVDLQLQLSQITQERDTLRQDFEKRVRDDCGVVVQERNKLLKDHKELKNTLQSAQNEAQRTREALERAELQQVSLLRQVETLSLSNLPSGSLIRFLQRVLLSRTAINIVIVTVSTALIIQLWEWPPSGWKSLQLSLLLAMVVGSILILLRDWLVHRNEALYRSSAVRDYFWLEDNVRHLRSIYMSMAEEWSSGVREEIAYRLRNVVDMPPDVGIRYAEDLIYKLPITRNEKTQFLTWIRLVLGLSASDRQLLLEQLQKTALRL